MLVGGLSGHFPHINLCGCNREREIQRDRVCDVCVCVCLSIFGIHFDSIYNDTRDYDIVILLEHRMIF